MVYLILALNLLLYPSIALFQTDAYCADPSFTSYDVSLPQWAQGFVIPIEGATVPDSENLLPNARRNYRNGTHEGVDIFCEYGTPVMAGKDGYVIDISGYQKVPSGFKSRLLDISGKLPETPPEILRVLHGRRITIEHGMTDGKWVVTVYSHLSQVAKGLAMGDFVRQGEIIGYVGCSGTDSEGEKNGSHLHFEIRINSHYLGEGMTPNQAGRLYRTILKDKSPLRTILQTCPGCMTTEETTGAD